VWQVVARENSKIKIYAKFWVLFIKDTFCSGLFLNNFETYQNYLIKSTIEGINFTLFHVQPYILELSIRHFQTPKDQGYLKLTKKFQKIDIAQPPKCPFFNPKNPLCAANHLLCNKYRVTLSILVWGLYFQKVLHREKRETLARLRNAEITNLLVL